VPDISTAASDVLDSAYEVTALAATGLFRQLRRMGASPLLVARERADQGSTPVEAVGFKMKTKYTFNIEQGLRGMWFATSPEVKGLLVAEHTLGDCLSAIVPTLENMDLATRLELGIDER
jgi:hypothetical protein